MKLILKVSTVNTVRDSVPGYPLMNKIATLGCDFSYFGDLPKIHLDPLTLVIPPGYIGSGMVDSSFAWSMILCPLPTIIKCTSFHKSIYCS